MKANHNRGGKGGTPMNDDDVILRYFSKNPDAPVMYVQQTFHCSPRRAAALKRKAHQLLEVQRHAKKTGVVNWREIFQHAIHTKELKRKGSWSQDHAAINIQNKYGIKKPIVIQCLADTHIGSLATNYEALEEITDGILNTPNLFVILNGDLTETTAVFKNALAIHSQSMDIQMQHDVLDSWLNTIAPKVLSAGWDNHGIEREEKNGAYSHIKELLNRRFIYHNGMGEIEIEHGAATYRLVVSHKISGYSIFNQLHGAKRLMRLQFPNADICMTADKHTPDVETYYEGKFKRAAIMCGSMKIDDGYSKRYFSLYTHMDMPCVVLYPDTKHFIVTMNAGEALAIANNMPIPPQW